MIFRHYRELVRAVDAEKWFGITPAGVEAAKAAIEGAKPENVVAMPNVAQVA